MTMLRQLASIVASAAVAVLATMLALALGDAQAAADFAPPGSKATLSVEYAYVAEGRRQDVNDLRQWRVRRHLAMTAQLTATKPTTLPAMQPIDARQLAGIEQQRAAVDRASRQMAPMMAGAEAILAKCGDDEKCMEREAMKMGAAMSASPQQIEQTRRAGAQAAAAVAPGAAHFQVWRDAVEKGSYQIDESLLSVLADPACQPRSTCKREVLRQGQGAIAPRPGGAAVEVDLRGERLALRLPLPLGPLDYAETVLVDELAATEGKPSRQGPMPRQLVWRITADGQVVPTQPLVVPLRGGWRSQSGEQVVKMNGAFGDGGTMTIRWRFEVR